MLFTVEEIRIDLGCRETMREPLPEKFPLHTGYQCSQMPIGIVSADSIEHAEKKLGLKKMDVGKYLVSPQSVYLSAALVNADMAFTQLLERWNHSPTSVWMYCYILSETKEILAGDVNSFKNWK